MCVYAYIHKGGRPALRSTRGSPRLGRGAEARGRGGAGPVGRRPRRGAAAPASTNHAKENPRSREGEGAGQQQRQQKRDDVIFKATGALIRERIELRLWSESYSSFRSDSLLEERPDDAFYFASTLSVWTSNRILFFNVRVFLTSIYLIKNSKSDMKQLFIYTPAMIIMIKE